MPAQVLIADDHSEMRRLLRSLLNDNSIEVCATASDGQEAVAMAERLQPDLAILDVFMPTMNGVDAALAIRKIAPETKIILLSLHFTNAAGWFAAEWVAADAFISKIDIVAKLMPAVRRVLNLPEMELALVGNDD